MGKSYGVPAGLIPGRGGAGGGVQKRCSDFYQTLGNYRAEWGDHEKGVKSLWNVFNQKIRAYWVFVILLSKSSLNFQHFASFWVLFEDLTSCGGSLFWAFGWFNVVWESTFWDFLRILRRVGEQCFELLEDLTSCGGALFGTFGGFYVVWGSSFLSF